MINRQLEMIYILMDRGTVTAQELAQRFEVSQRTVYRDVESLSMAGIPVYASRGKGGGIRLMDRFVLDKRLLSQEEQQKILAALASMQETGALGEGKILEKLGTFFKADPVSWVSIDFSDWSGRRGELFDQIREAILGRRVMTFDYYGQYGDMSRRQAEPVQLLFKEYTWYVRAWCRTRKAMRLFKVLRMKRVEVLEEIFEVRHIEAGYTQAGQTQAGHMNSGGADGGCENSKVKADKLPEACEENGLPKEEPVYTEVVVHIDRKEAYRVYDRFEEDEITVLPQGDFEIRLHYLVDDWVYGMILAFGDSARVLEPEWIRREMGRRIRRMWEYYEGEQKSQEQKSQEQKSQEQKSQEQEGEDKC